MKLRRQFVLFALATAMLLACKENQVVEQPDPRPVKLPLAAGNRWEYIRTFVDTTGKVTGVYNIVDSAEGPITVGNFTGYGIHNFLYFQLSIAVFANRTDGLYKVDNPASLPIPSPPPVVEKLLNSPTFEGDTSNYRTWSIRTRSMGESISVPAGSFQCLAYDISVNGSVISQLWLNSNVGIVKMWQFIGTARQINELKSYQIN